MDIGLRAIGAGIALISAAAVAPTWPTAVDLAELREEVSWSVIERRDDAIARWHQARWRAGDLDLQLVVRGVVEIRNRSTSPLELRGLQLAPLVCDDDPDVERAIALPASTALPPGGVIRVDISAWHAEESMVLVTPDGFILREVASYALHAGR